MKGDESAIKALMKSFWNYYNKNKKETLSLVLTLKLFEYE